MYSNSITQEEYDVTKQTNRYLHIKIKLLNDKFQEVDELSGTCVGTPSFTNNSDSDIRRTCSFSIVPTDSSFGIKYGNKIWLDKYIKVYVGIENNKTDTITYTNMGLYVVHNPSSNYSAINNTLSIQGLDLMCKLNGIRGGTLEDIPVQIPHDSKIREQVINLILASGFTEYVVNINPEDTIPYDINIASGSTIYNILTSIRDVMFNYQFYFDVNGVFHFDEIPNGVDEQIFIDDDIWSRVLINYDKSVDYSSVKNFITVRGKMHNIRHFADEEHSFLNGDTYELIIPSVKELVDLVRIGFIFDESNIPNEPKIKINSFDTYPLVNEDGTPTLLENPMEYYVFKFDKANSRFVYLGRLEPLGIAKEDNPESPFYINGTMGIVRENLKGGDYDNIPSDDLAQQRAEWELYQRCRLKDSVTLNCLPVYWADVNKLISITLPNKLEEPVTELYIIKNINTSFGVSGTQSIDCMKYYPFYPSVKRLNN